MPEINNHKAYDEYIDEVKKCRDCYIGQKAIKAAGTTYLPKLAGASKEVENRYKAFKARALFLNAFGKTIETFTGMIFRKDLIIESTSEQAKQALKEKITDKYDLETFLSKKVVQDILQTGKGGILVDFPRIENPNDEILTQEDVEKMGLKASMFYYLWESIIDWGDNYYVLEEVKTILVNDDIFEKEEITQRRVLDIEPNSQKYRQRIYEKIKDGKGKAEWQQVGEDIYPTINGKKLDHIPFYVIQTSEDHKPPLLDLADINIQHYQVYADYRNGIHFTGFPQAVTYGHKKDNQEYIIGSDQVWEFREHNAKAEFLEYQGSGLMYPQQLLVVLEDKMAQFGARMLMTEKKSAETARKAEIDRSGESSGLGMIATTISSAVTEACKTLLKWNLIENAEDLKIELNQDYVNETADPQLINALWQMAVGGGISYDTFWKNMQKIEIGSSLRSADDEKQLIDAESPLGGMLEE